MARHCCMALRSVLRVDVACSSSSCLHVDLFNIPTTSHCFLCSRFSGLGVGFNFSFFPKDDRSLGHDGCSVWRGARQFCLLGWP